MRTDIDFSGAINAINEGIFEGLNKEYKPLILAIVQSRTPEDTGKLKESEKVEVFKESGRVVCEVSANTPYAKIQHEMPQYFHKKGESGYILNPMIETIEAVDSIIAESIKKRLNGGNKKW